MAGTATSQSHTTRASKAIALEQDSTVKAAPPSSIGFIQSFLIASALLLAVRLGIEQLNDPVHKKVLLVAAISAVVLFGTIRAIALKAMLLLGLACAAYVLFDNWGHATTGKMKVSEIARQTLSMASGYAPIKKLRDSFQPNLYAKYVNAVDVRDAKINVLASKIVANCEAQDVGCQARAIALWVSNGVHYVADPTTGGEYVKPPLQTLEAMAGDCDDQTVLASSLLGTIGIKSVFVFEKRHVYPRACFAAKVPPKYLDSDVYAMHGQYYCYDLEPTAKGTGLGVRHKDRPVEAVVDVQTKVVSK